MSDSAPQSIASTGRRRRHPWVAYLVCAGLLCGSLVVLLTGPDQEGELLASADFAEAVIFFERNPDVRTTERFAQLLGHALVADARAVHEAKRRAGGVPILSERILKKSQKKFDRLERAALASLGDLPSWRFGIGGDQTPFSNWFTHLTVHETMLSLVVSMLFLTLAAITLEGAWGTLLFGLFALALPLLSAGSHRVLYPDPAAPWAGPSTVIAALLGAYFFRSFKGFVVPGWIVLPVWIILEYLFVRDISLSEFDMEPVVVHSIGFGFGAVVALAIQLTGLEDSFQRQQPEEEELLSNPVLEQALQVREDGDPELAFKMLEEELVREPLNPDIAVALWEVARRLERCKRIEPTMLAGVRACLRAGQRERATELWNTVSMDIRKPAAESTLLVRIGEALVDEGHRDAGLRAFELALDSPRRLSSILACRVVRATREIHVDLAGRAAAIALVDDQLDPNERDDLQAFVARVDAGDARERPDRRKGPRRKVEAGTGEPAAVSSPADATRAATGSNGATGPTLDSLTADLQQGVPDADPDPLQDPHALSADAFDDVSFDDVSLADDASRESLHQPGDVEDLSASLDDLGRNGAAEDEADKSGFDWGGLDALAADDADLDDVSALDSSALDPSALDPSSLDPSALEQEALDADALDSAEIDPADLDSLALGMDAAGADALDPGALDPALLAGEAVAEDAGPIAPSLGARPKDSEGKDSTETTETLDVPELSSALSEVSAGATAGGGDEPVVCRPLLVRGAVPIQVDGEGISCEVDGGAKMMLSFDRVDAVAVAAVAGLSDKPVILIDLVLNWLDLPGTPLKVIRLRSDGFDPRRLHASESALEALRGVVELILGSSSATPLPGQDAVRGAPFASFPGLAAYEKAVLLADQSA